LKSARQIRVFPTTVWKIMSSPHFALGASDRRAGRGYPAAYAAWRTNDQWDYERGRAWAVSAPRSIELRRGGKLNPEAVRWYHGDIL
jgi:hypothetical protein